MKLVIGLGNPDKKYEATWHNLGFLAVTEIQKQNKLAEFKLEKKFQATVTQNTGEQKIILAQPQTYMNNSGQTVKALVNFYKIKPEDILVIHDDIDIPLGKVRISYDATAAGHKGVQSIINELGSQKFYRLRLGIKSEKQGRIPTEDYVLQRIEKEAKVIVKKTIQAASEAANLVLAGRVAEAMNQYN